MKGVTPEKIPANRMSGITALTTNTEKVSCRQAVLNREPTSRFGVTLRSKRGERRIMYPSVHTPIQTVRALFRARCREIWRARRAVFWLALRDRVRPPNLQQARARVRTAG
jgi:hypothetical protein